MKATPMAGLAGLAFAALGCASAVAEGESVLQPFQIVRSLELVQDRIAGGDHAALPMQRRLLEMSDARLRAMAGDDFDEPRNVQALLVYAMSGGNPTTVEIVLARMASDDPRRTLGGAILMYLHGQPSLAEQALATVDPLSFTPELGAYLALVKGSVLAAEQPAAALSMLDQTRLLAPGTLVEEAALRRSITVTAALGDASRFALASSQYVQSYLTSPYASQFADGFVAGVITLHAGLSTDAIGEIAAMMDPEREKVIYLRIARRAAIEGLNELSAFAAAKAEAEGDDPRALLYSSLSTVASGSVDDVRAGLARIDRTRLSQSDRQLFDAASAVATGVTAAPAQPLPAETEPAADKALPVDASKAEAEPLAPDIAEPIADASVAGVVAAHASDAAPATLSANVEAADPTDTMVLETRRKLDDIDKLLGNAAK